MMPAMHVVLCIMFILMVFNTLLINQCGIRQQSKNSRRTGTPVIRLAVVLPYTAKNRSTILDSLERWKHAGSACSNHLQNAELRSTSIAQLFFYANGIANEDERKLVESSRFHLTKHEECFSKVHVIGAELTPEEDVYPAGPTNMFFKLFFNQRLQRELRAFTHMFWMEHDVYPLRAGWVDALLHEAVKGGFWISGSGYLGSGLDSAVGVPSNWDWVGHINGNALYDLRDDAFREFLQLVMQYEPPNHFWKPFDVSIWRVLHAFPYTWPLYQKYRSKFVYSNYIHHWGFHVSKKDWDFSISKPEVHLLHGANFSAGNLLLRPKPAPPDTVWIDRVPKTLRLSIMIRGSVSEMPFCYEAAMSAVKNVPEALEIVLVVPQSALAEFQTNFSNVSSLIRVIGEDPILEDQHMQQKWLRLHADLYCKGDLILHLDSDVIFNRELQLRDLLWLGKPILVYERYESLEAAGIRVLWQEGTSFALGAAVKHEFSRSPLHIYPRSFYSAARKHIETQHMTDIKTFLGSLLGQHMLHTNGTLLFNEFSYMGAYAWKHAQDSFALAPLDADERGALLLPPPIVLPPLCKANSRHAQSPTTVEALLKTLRDIWSSGLPCERMQELLRKRVHGRLMHRRRLR